MFDLEILNFVKGLNCSLKLPLGSPCCKSVRDLFFQLFKYPPDSSLGLLIFLSLRQFLDPAISHKTPKKIPSIKT
jgi:hypothetical protein